MVVMPVMVLSERLIRRSSGRRVARRRSRREWPDREIAQRGSRHPTAHRVNDRIELQELRTPEVQPVLLGLIDGPDRIVAVRRAALFDVSAEEVRYSMGTRKPSESLDASRERGRVSDVQSARIERVAGQQHACSPIVDRNTGRLMSGDRKNVEHATAQVERGRIVRPAVNAKERTHGGRVTSNDGRARASDEL